jgi:hypothetical protein
LRYSPALLLHPEGEWEPPLLHPLTPPTHLSPLSSPPLNHSSFRKGSCNEASVPNSNGPQTPGRVQPRCRRGCDQCERVQHVGRFVIVRLDLRRVDAGRSQLPSPSRTGSLGPVGTRRPVELVAPKGQGARMRARAPTHTWGLFLRKKVKKDAVCPPGEVAHTPSPSLSPRLVWSRPETQGLAVPGS